MHKLPGVSWVQCDLLDVFDVEEVMKGVTDVYHCAAMVSFHPKDREQMLHFNIASTANVVNEALLQGVRKFIYTSSIASLGRNAITKEISEEEQWEESKYNSTYALSKHQAELEVWRGIAEGLNAVIINPGLILGEGNWDEGTARFMKIADKEFPFYTNGVNGWVDVQDVVKLMHLLMQSDIAEERFIVCEGNHSYKKIFTLMAQALGRKPPRFAANSFMTGFIWRFNVLKNLLTGANITITKETARNAQKQSFYNTSKLKTYLPDFAYTPINNTITRMAKAFLQATN